MVWRVFRFFLFQLAGAVLGRYLPIGDPRNGMVVGIVLAGALWVLVDLRRGMRLLAWLKEGDTSAPVRVSGLWGEVADRSWRLTRSREKQVSENRDRLNDFLAAIQASPNGVVLLDAQDGIEWCNETAAGHFGFDPQRDVQQHIGNLLRDPGFVAYLNGDDYAGDIVIRGPRSTSSRPVQLAVHLHGYGEGRKLLLSRDVTAVQQAEVMRRDFVANVSHEIRTPLTVLGGFVETLQTLPLNDDERARYLELMAQQARRMQTLVSDLLTLSRLEGSPPPGTNEWVPVSQLMAQCEQDGRDLSQMLVTQSHDMNFLQEGRCDIAGSHSELLSAMTNLVSNAVRYTPAGGTIEVRWQNLADGRAEFSVRDSGPGIAAEHIPRLTERFYRIDRSRSRETGGTGLGLAIVKHVLQRHGAELKIESLLGQGARFSMMFPATRVRQLPA
ncbi:MAG: phosphate regulon sensor histidine kinase PhoR [Pseudomonadota bacterium]|uniref:phosphate regulon sensor histidine kinase PhoR n=1 Tax=Polaromonas sp. TaxID=1869339 RepID=UPI0017BECDF2|nr:phosphate regulon sensor histidine kinase PhoR [Polaromonas sp.]MBA3594697.1 phosphate regulon sensor histidine kinase PhoR [Polaromonas sp.]MDQ3271066.1 phosphate regulon sensor histidine kinase PhoR [Pseudomonadota bacterium]